jgi:RHS repeat-associated protein
MQPKTAFILILALISLQAFSQRTPLPAGYLSGTPINYVRTWQAVAPEKNPNTLMGRPTGDVLQTTQYIDGIGRPVQSVVKSGSLVNSTNTYADMVSAAEYDALGREQFKYLPFASYGSTGNAASADGLLKSDPFQQQAAFYHNANAASPVKGQEQSFFYERIKFEASPLSRPTEVYNAGNSWVGTSEDPNPANRRGVRISHKTNTPADVIRIWTVTNSAGAFGSYASAATYQPGELLKKISTDEKGNQVIEFKDKSGRDLLKKVQVLSSAYDDGSGKDHTGWLCTYYVYDDLNQLRCVIQPRAVEAMSVAANWSLSQEQLEEFCFRYEYDHKGRVIMKKVPGVAPLYMVYDGRDRLVLTQDGRQRQLQPAEWSYTKYDDLNRPVSTGIYINSQSHQQHIQAAASSAGYPVFNNDYWELTVTFYDNYDWLPAYSGHGFTANAYSHGLPPASNSWPYPQEFAQSKATYGMVTGMKVRELASGQDLYSINYYDEEGRLIQTRANNVAGGTDTYSMQYSFGGQVLHTVMEHHNNSSTAQTYTIQSRNSYDKLGRLVKVEKKYQYTTCANCDIILQDWKVIAEYGYDARGQLSKKKLAPNGGTSLQELDYDYNIRGWVLGMNREYAKNASAAGKYFGFELGYDNTGIKTAGGATVGSYAKGQYNGNVAGTVWRSKGDDQRRKYDFDYDIASRLLKGDFTQHNGTAYAQDNAIDFSMKMGDGSDPFSAYDANGNILRMQHWGLKGVSSSQLDDLRYTYYNDGSSNKLKNVIDFVNDENTKLGDFRTSALHPQKNDKINYAGNPLGYNPNLIVDYTYDANGNLVKDLNKDLVASGGANGIEYNHLNLPKKVTLRDKGTIEYVYDATGVKLKKIVKENIASSSYTGELKVTTTYIGGFVYESRQYTPAHATIQNYTDRLLLIGHEEGRIRFEPTTGAAWDYFIKDHLGNIRMVLTDQVLPAEVYQATIETARRNHEVAQFGNQVSNTEDAKPSSFDTDNDNQKVSKLNAFTSGARVGPGVVLKVMAGDKFKALTKAWYQGGDYTRGDPNVLGPLVDQLLGQMVPGITSIGKGGNGAHATNSNVQGALNGFLSPQQNSTDDSRPHAYLNWVLLDEEQFKQVNDNMGSVRVPEILSGQQAQVLQAAGGAEIEVKKNGFLYIYVSNESKTNVYFDDIRVEHIRGPLIEETHYYPFGLAMAGISSKAAGRLENRYGFNGGEEQNAEFSDGSGLEWVDLNARMYDPQLGRFFNPDPMAEYMRRWSPYAFGFNNPLRYNDPTGLNPGDSTYYLENGKPKMFYHEEVFVKIVLKKSKKNDSGNTWFDTLLDGIGVIDPTGVVDLFHAGLYALQGDFSSAGLTALGALPFGLGEAGKFMKYTDEAVDAMGGVAKYSDEAEEVVEQAAKKAEKGSGTSGALRKVGTALESVDDVMANPGLLKGKSPLEVEAILGKTPGWRVEKLGQGSQKGNGWVLRQYNSKGNPTGPQIRWHPGGGHHGLKPYWRVIGPQGDVGGIIR